MILDAARLLLIQESLAAVQTMVEGTATSEEVSADQLAANEFTQTLRNEKVTVLQILGNAEYTPEQKVQLIQDTLGPQT